MWADTYIPWMFYCLSVWVRYTQQGGEQMSERIDKFPQRVVAASFCLNEVETEN